MDFMGGGRRPQYKNVNLLEDIGKQRSEEKDVSPTGTTSSKGDLSGGNIKPPQSLQAPSSGLKHPEGLGGKPREGLRLPESSSGLKMPEKSPTLRMPEGAGLRPPGSVGGGLKSPNATGLQSSFRSHSVSGETKLEQLHNSNSSESELTSSSESTLKPLSSATNKPQRSLSMGRSLTPGFGPSKISKPSTGSGSSSELLPSSGGVSSERSGLIRPGGGRLQPPGDHKHSPQPPEKREEDSNEHVGLKPPGLKLGEHKSNISGPPSSSGLPGPSRITGRGNYQNVKLQNKDSSPEKQFGLPQHPGKGPGKVEKSPEPERSSSLSKPTKLQQISQLSRIKPAGSPPLRQSSEPIVKAESMESITSNSSDNLLDTENKPVSKLALITKKQSSPCPATTKSTDIRDNHVPRKVSEPAPALEPQDPVGKPKLHPPPLEINTTTPETTPTKSDNRSSGSSIGSFTSSLNSQSELDVQTPSPLGGRKYVRRTSPEGMSVDETASPRDLNKLSDLSNESKEEVFSLMSSGEDIQANKDKENLLAIETGLSSKVKRAQSLSPKASRRIIPLQPQSAMIARTSVNNGRSTGRGSLENVDKHVKPGRSSLRSPRQPGDTRTGKHVTISPHSSVESFTSSDNSLIHVSVALEESRMKHSSQTERPKSLEDLESHNFSLGSYPGDLHPHLLSNNLVRRGSTRSEKLDYSEESSFLQKNLSDENEGKNSTPEVCDHCNVLLCIVLPLN